MNILYCGDSNIKDGLLISILSLCKQVKEAMNIYVFTLSLKTEDREYEPISEEYITYIENVMKTYHADHKITRVDLSENFHRELPAANVHTRFTPCCMLRLFADQVPGLPDKLLYLDTDVICRMDCSEFYEQDIENYEFAGAFDYYGRWFFRKKLWKSDYMNSGVLLLNMKKIKETGLFSKCREQCATTNMFMPDQSALNKLSEAKLPVARKYNEQRRLHQDTVFQHFTTSFRLFPWVHTLTVKPWDIDRMHSVLKLYEYDDILEEYQKLKQAG